MAAAILNRQTADVPVQAPDHPPNVEPVEAEAIKFTKVPALKFALHVPPQLIPAGELNTVPLPGPALMSVSA